MSLQANMEWRLYRSNFINPREVSQNVSPKQQSFLHTTLWPWYISILNTIKFSKDIKIIKITNFTNKICSWEITQTQNKREQSFLHKTHHVYLLYNHTKYYQNIWKWMKVTEGLKYNPTKYYKNASKSMSYGALYKLFKGANLNRKQRRASS